MWICTGVHRTAGVEFQINCQCASDLLMALIIERVFRENVVQANRSFWVQLFRHYGEPECLTFWLGHLLEVRVSSFFYESM
jgi:hypothetical protein